MGTKETVPTAGYQLVVETKEEMKSKDKKNDLDITNCRRWQSILEAVEDKGVVVEIKW